MPNRNTVIQDEAQAWRNEGRITPEFHEWIRKNYPVGADANVGRQLQTVLLMVASVLVLVGIVTLVAEFWDGFTRSAKFWLLVGFAVASGVLARLFATWPRTRALTFVLGPLVLPLYLFAMVYVQDDQGRLFDFANNPLTLTEIAAVAVGVLLALGALVAGIHHLPTLALAAPPSLLFALGFLRSYMSLDFVGERAHEFTLLAVVLLLHALLLAVWTGALRLPRPWKPYAVRLAVAANVPWGFALILMLVGGYAYSYTDGRQYFDETWVGVPLTAVYCFGLLLFALRWGLPELTAVSGVFLVGDAIWLGSDKGGVLGAVIAIFATAILLIVLAQRGVFGKIFRPRAPPASAEPESEPRLRP